MARAKKPEDAPAEHGNGAAKKEVPIGVNLAKGPDMQVWQHWRIVLQVEGPFGASIPRTPEEIRNLIKYRMPERPPENFTPAADLVEQVMDEVGVKEDDESTWLPGWATFKRDDALGLYYEGRCVRSHLKDAALQMADMLPSIKNFRAKFVNRCYVLENKIPVGKREPDGTEQRFLQVLTRQGPRSSIKYVDYVNDPTLTFTLEIKADGLIDDEHLRLLFAYGGRHGMGAERSMSWGRYTLTELVRLD